MNNFKVMSVFKAQINSIYLVVCEEFDTLMDQGKQNLAMFEYLDIEQHIQTIEKNNDYSVESVNKMIDLNKKFRAKLPQ